MLLTASEVQTGVIDGVGWLILLGGLALTALWLYYLVR